MKTKLYETKSSGVENLTVNFEVKQIDDSDPHLFKLKGYASTFGNLDHGRDKVLKGAFLDTIRAWEGKTKKLPVLWQHDIANPLGVFTHLAEDEKGLYFEAELPKEDTFVSGRVVPQVKIGSIASMSIGFVAVEFRFEEAPNGEFTRVLIKLDLHEISLVTIPMNDQADITGFKNAHPFADLPLADSEVKWDSEAAAGRVQEHSESKHAFLGEGKFLIADVIEGKLMVVPSAVFAAAAAISGSQGAIDTPENELKAIKHDITKYYKKMDRESPFEQKTCFRVDFIEQLSDRELEKLLKKGVFFSQNQAKKLVKLLKTPQCDAAGIITRDAKSFSGILADIKKF